MAWRADHAYRDINTTADQPSRPCAELLIWICLFILSEGFDINFNYLVGVVVQRTVARGGSGGTLGDKERKMGLSIGGGLQS